MKTHEHGKQLYIFKVDLNKLEVIKNFHKKIHEKEFVLSEVVSQIIDERYNAIQKLNDFKNKTKPYNKKV